MLLIDVSVWKLVSVFEKSKKAQEEIAIQNQLATVQIESQQEIRAMYEQMRALKHDVNYHPPLKGSGLAKGSVTQ